jgi:hypothetical protein
VTFTHPARSSSSIKRPASLLDHGSLTTNVSSPVVDSVTHAVKMDVGSTVAMIGVTASSNTSDNAPGKDATNSTAASTSAAGVTADIAMTETSSSSAGTMHIDSDKMTKGSGAIKYNVSSRISGALTLTHWVKQGQSGDGNTSPYLLSGFIFWQNVLEVEFAKYSKHVPVLEYTDAEFSSFLSGEFFFNVKLASKYQSILSLSLSVSDPDWSKEESDYLLELCRAFDLKFIIIADRYEFPEKNRTVEVHFHCVCSTHDFNRLMTVLFVEIIL